MRAYCGGPVARLLQTRPRLQQMKSGGRRTQRKRYAQSAVWRQAWYVLEPDASLVMPNPEGMWEELVRRTQRLRNTI